jgi:hypothetical protein
MKERPKKGGGVLAIEGPSIAGDSVRSADCIDTTIVVGARFKMSSLGAVRNPNFAGNEGKIVGSSNDSVLLKSVAVASLHAINFILHSQGH